MVDVADESDDNVADDVVDAVEEDKLEAMVLVLDASLVLLDPKLLVISADEDELPAKVVVMLVVELAAWLDVLVDELYALVEVLSELVCPVEERAVEEAD